MQVLRRLAHLARVVVGTFAAAAVAGAAGGLGARLGMWLVKLGNGSYNGQVTHDGFEVGRLTPWGTLNLVFIGLSFGVFSAAVPYLIVRRWLPGRGWQKGLWFGLWLLTWATPLVIDVGNHEYFRYASPAVSFPLFASLIPLTSVLLGTLAERWGGACRSPISNRPLRWGGQGVLVLTAAAGTWFTVQTFRSVAHAF